ncbi:SpoIIE family protein phosphatase [Paractinoplanes lichenicola]|uniref:SpoIIE family protein phosphatase n=1 Tax=Paractinoplanes lichenicola TaxID=2802976 RepID=A0ABS1VWZ8_9ACTN|nr:SpoIIE family protein phosphatase [Actinoplanes lichenicola]MBL7259010.1 SpoIIE family protein phosphatase [Actinoplanes lichenicola]
MADNDPLDRTVGDAEVVRQVFDQMPLLVFALDGPDLRLSAASGAYRTYVGRAEMIGERVWDVYSEVAGQQVLEIFEQVYRTGEPAQAREMRVLFHRPDLGEDVELYVDFNVVPRRGPDGALVGLVSDVVDSTARVLERQAAQQRVDEAERRYAEVLDVVQALQRELLPAGVPVLPRLHIAGAYLLADADTAAGGDWFDAVALPDGRVALVVGDVVGHGVTASATMGQLRVLLNERLLATGDVRAAVADVDRMSGRIRGAHAATIGVAVLDPVTGDLTYCTAGHPPPLLVPLDGEPRYLPGTGDGPLGTGNGDFSIGTERLGQGDVLLLYTDGILERPGRTLARATVELAKAGADTVAGRALPDHDRTVADRVCNQTLEMLVRVTGHSDDITLLAAQRVAAPAPFAVTVPADLGLLLDLRKQLGDWMERAAIADGDAGMIEHAINELVTNGMEHAYGDPAAGSVEVTAEITAAGELRAEVRDRGRWREPSSRPGRGLGLVMTRNLVGSLRLDHGDSGTTATITHPLTRPVRLLSVSELSPGTAAPTTGNPDPFLVLEQPDGSLRVDGPVDARTAQSLENALVAATAAGTRDLTVDLTGVTHLASAGVAALHRVSALAEGNNGRLRLVAPPGSPANMIMTLVGLVPLS